MKNFIKNGNGDTAVEYALLAALISVVAITIFQAVGVNLSGVFNTISGAMNR